MWRRLPSSKNNHEKLWKWNTIGTCFSSTKDKKTRSNGRFIFTRCWRWRHPTKASREHFFCIALETERNAKKKKKKTARNSISSNCMLYKLCWRWKEKFILESSIPLPPHPPPTVMYSPCSNNGWRIRKTSSAHPKFSPLASIAKSDTFLIFLPGCLRRSSASCFDETTTSEKILSSRLVSPAHTTRCEIYSSQLSRSNIKNG